MSFENELAAIHKIDINTKKGPRARRPHKEEAIFDNELQRYVMPGERIIMPRREQKRSAGEQKPRPGIS